MQFTHDKLIMEKNVAKFAKEEIAPAVKYKRKIDGDSVLKVLLFENGLMGSRNRLQRCILQFYKHNFNR